MEHRWGQRKSLDLAVRVRLAEPAIIEGRMRNISLSGAYVEAPEAPATFARVRIEPVWAPTHVSCATARRRNLLSLKAHVVRRDARGFGIEWLEFAARTLQRLLTLNRVELLPVIQPRPGGHLSPKHAAFLVRSSVAAVPWASQPCRGGEERAAHAAHDGPKRKQRRA